MTLATRDARGRAGLAMAEWCARSKETPPASARPEGPGAPILPAESPECSAWNIPAEGGRREVTRPNRLRQLAARWLSPFAANGIREEDLLPRLGYNRSACERKAPSRICPLVIVMGGEIFVYIPHKSRLFPERLPSCESLASDSPGGSAMRRFLPVLRMVRSMVKTRAPEYCRDFAIRVCVDEFCHGDFEGRAIPWLTMISCAGTPSLPAVQWNTLKGRDPNLSEWDAELLRRAAVQPDANASWPCRESTAVWRGSAAEPFSTNMRWTTNHTLSRLAVTRGRWRQQGRLALMWQHCNHPELLNVFMRGVQGPDPQVGKPLLDIEDFTRCITKMGIHKEKVLSLADQARRFRYIVHVEGVGGWADRLKHLLLSYATVLKQDMGVLEWFEPLLHPYVHFVPVTSTLSNISDSIHWLHHHEDEALQIANSAAALGQEIFSLGSLSVYMEELLLGYSRLYRDSQAVPALLTRLPQTEIVRFDCSTKSGNGGFECFFAHIHTRKRVESVMAAAEWTGSVGAC